MTTAIKERPILFSGPMVRALLNGSKTQTRRIVKPQPHDKAVSARFIDRAGWEWWGKIGDDKRGLLYQHSVPCPFGNVGDRLWVRESFLVAERYSYGTDASGEQITIRGVPVGPVHYCADGPAIDTPNKHYPNGLKGGKFAAPDPYAIWVARPSIHMPRWASRITLKITGVRVERLQEISSYDCEDEGVSPCTIPDSRIGNETQKQAAYRLLWESINGDGSWALNPWVWVIEFRRVEA